MRRMRRSGGFTRLGEVGAERLGLPSRRGRELSLAVAWQRAAGERLAGLARPVSQRRGVLELELLESAGDEGRRQVEASLEQLAEALSVRRVRLRPDPARTARKS